jgi:hypothetical protein
MAKQSPNRCHWRVIESKSGNNPGIASTIYDQLAFPLRTEMAYQLDHEQEKEKEIFAFIVALSIEKIEYKPYKLKFLSGLAVAIFVAAFDLEEEEKERRQSVEKEKELDVKEFLPMRPHNSSVSLATMGTNNHVPFLDFTKLDLRARAPSASEEVPVRRGSVGEGIAAADPRDERKKSTGGSCHSMVGLDLSVSDGGPTAPPLGSPKVREGLLVQRSPRASELPPLELSLMHSPRPDALDEILPTPRSMVSVGSRTDLNTGGALVPAWQPATEFSFPIFQIPVKHHIPNDLTMESFADVKHVADGSNSNIFLARYQGQRVVIKMVKQQAEHDPIAVQEFDLEYGTLARISHPHIIRILGAGNVPRRFIVLEWLGGGTLNTLLAENQQSLGLAQKFFHRPTFTYASLLQNAKHIAEALEYLHHRCHQGATIIHRGQ